MNLEITKYYLHVWHDVEPDYPARWRWKVVDENNHQLRCGSKSKEKDAKRDGQAYIEALIEQEKIKTTTYRVYTFTTKGLREW